MIEGKDIQVDGGDYTRIHYAILEALSKARLSGAEYRCVLFLLRKTYGWNKKEDRISLSQWAEGTESKRNHVLTTLNSLVAKKVIYRRDDGQQIPVYGFNKYWEQWEGVEVDSERGTRFDTTKVLPKQVTVPKQVTAKKSVTRAGTSTVTRAGNRSVTKAGTHNRHIDTVKDKVAAPHQIVFGILSRICRLDPNLKGGQIGRTAKSLIKANYGVEVVEYFETWWKENDFRGKRDEPPTLAQVLEKIPQAKQAMPTTAQRTPQTVTVLLPGGGTVERTQ